MGVDLGQQSEFNRILGVSLAKNSMAIRLARNSRTNMKTRLKTIACEFTSFFLCIIFFLRLHSCDVLPEKVGIVSNKIPGGSAQNRIYQYIIHNVESGIGPPSKKQESTVLVGRAIKLALSWFFLMLNKAIFFNIPMLIPPITRRTWSLKPFFITIIQWFALQRFMNE